MLSRLRGMFAFAIWDSEAQSIFLARDRVGIKPLYFLVVPGERLYFASEVKAIIADPRVKRAVEPRALMQYLFFGHSSAPLTMFAGNPEASRRARPRGKRGGGLDAKVLERA